MSAPGLLDGPEPALPRGRILIVDDNATNVQVLRAMLVHAGAEEIESTTDPTEVAQICERFAPDIVLLDLHMPVLDGFAVMGELTTAREDQFLPIVVLTADGSPDTRTRALAAGATDFLTKPLDRVEVVLRVRNLLRTRNLHVRLQRHTEDLERQLREQQERDARARYEQQAKLRRIRGALDSRSLTMWYQPIADLETGAVLGVEALARFVCEPQRTPDIWFAEAADVGLGVELELAAVAAAISSIDAITEGAYLSLNVSPETALSPDLAAVLRGAPAGRLVLEITEHAAVEDYDLLNRRLVELRAAGMRLAVDDAGAGFSSLQHILRLRPDIIKLDMTLTRDVDADPVRRALAAALVSFAAELRADVVAEGIETSAERDTLRTLGVRCGQGYHLGRPAPLSRPAPQPLRDGTLA